MQNKPIASNEDTYSLAKAFYHIKNAAHHFESILLSQDAGTRAKAKFRTYKMKLDWVLNDLTTELTAESAQVFKREVQTYETLAFDAVQDAMVLMTQEQRELLERVCKHILQGDFELTETTNH